MYKILKERFLDHATDLISSSRGTFARMSPSQFAAPGPQDGDSLKAKFAALTPANAAGEHLLNGKYHIDRTTYSENVTGKKNLSCEYFTSERQFIITYLVF